MLIDRYFCYTFICTENPEAIVKYDAVARRQGALKSQGLVQMNMFMSQDEKRSGLLNNMKEASISTNSPAQESSNKSDYGRVEELNYLVTSLETEMTSRIMALNTLTEQIRQVRAEVRIPVFLLIFNWVCIF